MGYLLQPMTFKRLDQVRAWPFGYPEKNHWPTQDSLSMSGSHVTHLRLGFLFLFCEFAPYNKNYNWNVLELAWVYLPRVLTPFSVTPLDVSKPWLNTSFYKSCRAWQLFTATQHWLIQGCFSVEQPHHIFSYCARLLKVPTFSHSAAGWHLTFSL